MTHWLRCPRFARAVVPALVLLFLLVFTGTSKAEGVTTAQLPLKYEYYFVVDSSGSMVGLPQGSGNAVIFPSVLENLSTTIKGFHQGTEVTVYTFDRGIQTEFSRLIGGDVDRTALIDHVNGLTAKGEVTWIYQSLLSVLDKVKTVCESDTSVTHVPIIYLYTDGQDNSPAGASLDDLINAFKLRRAETKDLWLYFVTLGFKLNPEPPATDGITVTVVPKPEPISDGTTTPPTVPPLYEVQVTRPSKVDFGNMREAHEATREVEISYPVELEGVAFKVTADSPDMSRRGAYVELKTPTFALKSDSVSGDVHTMKLQLAATIANSASIMDSGPWAYEGTISLECTDGSKRVNVRPGPIPFS